MKRKINLVMLSLILFFGVLVPVTVQGEEIDPLAEGWQTIYAQNVTATTSGIRTPIVYSGGGDLRLCASGIAPGHMVIVQVWSDNGTGDSVDDFVLPVQYFINGGSSSSNYLCLPKINVRGYVDGSNNKAEFYTKVFSESYSDQIYLVIQD